MTEVDAIAAAHHDTSRIHASLQQGALPADLIPLITRRALAKIQRMHNPNAMNMARHAAQQRISAPTLSEQIATILHNIIQSTLRALHPEDTRAMILWLLGDGHAPGFLQGTLNLIGETSASGAIERTEQWGRAVLQRIDQADRQLFSEDVQHLNPSRRRVIHGMLRDARTAAKDRSGQEARAYLVRARQLAIRWTRRQQRLAPRA